MRSRPAGTPAPGGARRDARLPARLPRRAAPLLLAATLALLGCTAADEPPVERTEPPPQPPSSSPSLEPPRPPSAPELPGTFGQLTVLDGQNAFAVAECVDHDANPDTTCVPQLASLLSGAEWELRSAPDRGRLAALAPGRALLIPWETTESDAEPGTAGWYTDDAGRTWRATDITTSGTAGEIPAEGYLVGAGLPGAPRGEELGVLLPESGERHALAEQPPLGQPYPVPYPLADGSHAVFGTERDTSRLAVSVSRDRGRSWQTAPLPGTEEERRWWEPSDPPLIVAGHDTLYAAVVGRDPTGERPVGPQALLSLHRSEDGGGSWERVWEFHARQEPQFVTGTPIAATDGSLTLYGEHGIYRSEDGGRTFVLRRGGEPPEQPQWTAAGYLLTDNAYQGHFRVSSDGFTWHTLVLGGQD